MPPINKTMDRDDLDRPDCRLILAELFGLMRRMHARGAAYSSWYGRVDSWPSAWEHINRGESYRPHSANPDELAVPWFLLWEIAWLVANTPVSRTARVLDMGGAGSLFTCYLASRGIEVHTIDLQEELCRRSDQIAQCMNWRLHARRMDMTRLDYPDAHFDHVFSVCVFEHLPVSGRVKCNEEVRRVLRAGGTAAYTFDYANPQSFGRIDTPADVHTQFVEASSLRMKQDASFHDNGKRYLAAPQCFGFGRFARSAARLHAAATGQVTPARALIGNTSYTMGAVFLEKT
ncbi:MAG TPA: class I SAM-dependent methyltransferase [Phycisphaerae bacterium]|nr:class I SAM-dependent methyltransferase [Phycisphaerae bacterium]